MNALLVALLWPLGGAQLPDESPPDPRIACPGGWVRNADDSRCFATFRFKDVRVGLASATGNSDLERGSWMEAEDFCTQMSTSLVTFHHPDDDALMRKKLATAVDQQKVGPCWVGLRKLPKSEWFWIDDREYEMENVRAKKRSQANVDKCGAIGQNGLQDRACTSSKLKCFVCATHWELSDPSYVQAMSKFDWRSLGLDPNNVPAPAASQASAMSLQSAVEPELAVWTEAKPAVSLKPGRYSHKDVEAADLAATDDKPDQSFLGEQHKPSIDDADQVLDGFATHLDDDVPPLTLQDFGVLVDEPPAHIAVLDPTIVDDAVEVITDLIPIVSPIVDKIVNGESSSSTTTAAPPKALGLPGIPPLPALPDLLKDAPKLIEIGAPLLENLLNETATTSAPKALADHAPPKPKGIKPPSEQPTQNPHPQAPPRLQGHAAVPMTQDLGDLFKDAPKLIEKGLPILEDFLNQTTSTAAPKALQNQAPPKPKGAKPPSEQPTQDPHPQEPPKMQKLAIDSLPQALAGTDSALDEGSRPPDQFDAMDEEESILSFIASDLSMRMRKYETRQVGDADVPVQQQLLGDWLAKDVLLPVVNQTLGPVLDKFLGDDSTTAAPTTAPPAPAALGVVDWIEEQVKDIKKQIDDASTTAAPTTAAPPPAAAALGLVDWIEEQIEDIKKQVTDGPTTAPTTTAAAPPPAAASLRGQEILPIPKELYDELLKEMLPPTTTSTSTARPGAKEANLRLAYGSLLAVTLLGGVGWLAYTRQFDERVTREIAERDDLVIRDIF